MSTRTILALCLAGLLAPAGPTLAASAGGAAFKGASSAAAVGKDRTLDNTVFAFSGCGKGEGDHLLLRIRTTQKWNLDEVGSQAEMRLDAFDAAKPASAKPLYTLKVESDEATILENCLLRVNRGLEDFRYWDVHDLATGKLLFETMVEPLLFPIAESRETLLADAAGLYVPPDDESDRRLADPTVVGLLTLVRAQAAGEAATIQTQALITAADTGLAQRLRSYWDERRYLAVVDAATGGALGAASAERTLGERPLALEISWAEADLRLRIPLGAAGLDLEHAAVPPALRVLKLAKLRSE